MKPIFKIEGLRGSIFIPLIPFEWTFVNSLFEILPGFIPSVNQFAPPIKGALMPPIEWLIFSPDNKSRLIFQQQKVDFIVEAGIDYSPEIIKDFAEKCTRLFERIIDYSKQDSSRIAIAPTFKWVGENNLFVDFIKEIYSKNSFKGSSVDNCDFSQVFRVVEDINDKEIKLNYLSKFYTANSLAVVNGVNSIQESYMMDFDINTFVDPKYVFNKTAVCDFFSKAVVFCTNFMDFYFSEKV